MRKNTAYWACQICGWGAYSLVGGASAVLEHGWAAPVVIGYGLFFLYSIGLTHLLRAQIHRRDWMSLPLQRLLPRLAATSLLIALIQTGFVVAVYTAIAGNLGPWRDLPSDGFMLIGLTFVNAIWSALYLSITGMRQTREARRNEIDMKLALGEAELKALEAQINPHFLFNCLNSIRGMIVEDPARAQDMITRLANILRYNLRKDRSRTVPLASEVEVVSDYLALESIRFEERLRVHLDVDSAAAQRSVPPMLLQTLVENAIKHGVEDLPAGGDLFIRAGVEEGALRIEVENTGRLREPKTESTQIGLNNARERLRILYGE